MKPVKYISDGYQLYKTVFGTTHETMLDLKSDELIESGDVVTTSGYYSSGDGGNAIYLIVNTENAPEDKFVVQCKNGKSAVLIEEGPIDIRKLGASNTLEDNSNIIQCALDKFGTVVIPDGTFYIKSTIRLNSGNTLKGNSKKSIIKLADNSECENIILCDTIDHFTLSNFRIDGNKENNSKGTGIVIRSDNHMSFWSTVENMFVEKCKDDGLFQDINPWQTTIKDCIFSQCSGKGINNYATDVSFRGIYISNCKTGFYEKGSSNKISDIKISGSGLEDEIEDDGVYGNGFYSIGNARDLLSNIECQENRTNGFKFVTCNHISMSSCCSDRNGLAIYKNPNYVSSGVLFDQCSDFIGNIIIENYRRDNTQKYGVYIKEGNNFMDFSIDNCEVEYFLEGTPKINCKINGESVTN